MQFTSLRKKVLVSFFYCINCDIMSSKYLPNSCRARKDRGQRDSRRNAFFLHLLNAAKKTLDISTTSLNLTLEYLVRYFEYRVSLCNCKIPIKCEIVSWNYCSAKKQISSFRPYFRLDKVVGGWFCPNLI